MSVKVTDKSGKFVNIAEDALDQILSRAAIDIVRLAKMKVPQKTSGLQDSGRNVPIVKMKHMVVFNKEYAGYQEYGQRKDGSHKVKKYSTPGTGKRFLRDSAQQIVKELPIRIKAKVKTIVI